MEQICHYNAATKMFEKCKNKLAKQFNSVVTILANFNFQLIF